jgi:hypothetical protein
MPDSTETKVRCCDCGFLAYPNPATQALEEVTDEERKNGRLHGVNVSPGSYFGLIPSPKCFVMAFDLPLEAQQTYDQAITEQEKKESTKNVLERTRDCVCFCRWRQGYSPKEHKAMQQEQDLRQWQENRLKADREARDEDKKSDREYQEAQKAAENKRQDDQKQADRKWQLKLAMLAAAFSLVTGTIGLLLGKFMNPPAPAPQPPIINVINQKDGELKVEVPKQNNPPRQ